MSRYYIKAGTSIKVAAYVPGQNMTRKFTEIVKADIAMDADRFLARGVCECCGEAYLTFFRGDEIDEGRIWKTIITVEERHISMHSPIPFLQ